MAMTEGMYGLVGVIVGVVAGWLVPFIDRWRQRRRDAQYLAIRVVCILDKYVVDCATACNDRTEMDDVGQTHVSAPAATLADYAEDVDWKCIEADLMFGILSLPRDAVLARNWLDGYMEQADGYDIDSYAMERAMRYGKLDLQAATLADKLRRTYSIPGIKHQGWDPVEHIKPTSRNRR
jgi:hypothetical protein